MILDNLPKAVINIKVICQKILHCPKYVWFVRSVNLRFCLPAGRRWVQFMASPNCDSNLRADTLNTRPLS